MPLTDVAIRNAKAKEKSYKISDMLGLFLLISPSGSKLWRMKYRFKGAEKKLSLGDYPRVSLRDARKQRDVARDMLAEGKDPSFERHREKLRGEALAENTFTSIAQEYCNKRRRDGDRAWAPATATRCEYLLSLLDHSIGRMPIHEIEPIDALAAIRKIEKRGKLESARRTLQLASAVFRYAVATARLKSDPTRDLRGALTTPTVTHYGAVTEAAQVGELLRSIDGYEGQGMTKWALQLAPHVFVRPGELRHARWEEVNLETRVWIIPGEKMKMRKPHQVPLSRQSLAILEEIRSITGSLGYIFPSMRSRLRPMSENTLNSALRRLGYASNEMTAHGFRAMASTLLNESGKWSSDAIERSLAHGDSDKVRAAYHRGTHWKERVAMAQWWSDLLDSLRDGATILPFPEAMAG
ncbi:MULTISPECIES: integrase arm-type DNA-binding domain-containing protein [unclassified Novosphingobium]|uniref:tyrosine-type recombinase/integrase n=1 Tax=unclassified Novosphingobium TaxID=2644732 RepID=UPI00135A07D1|nr:MULTISPECIES: integrase arm-type DNA-binding domain-containing protein [unclassified Novosphingobium]